MSQGFMGRKSIALRDVAQRCALCCGPVLEVVELDEVKSGKARGASEHLLRCVRSLSFLVLGFGVVRSRWDRRVSASVRLSQ